MEDADPLDAGQCDPTAAMEQGTAEVNDGQGGGVQLPPKASEPKGTMGHRDQQLSNGALAASLSLRSSFPARTEAAATGSSSGNVGNKFGAMASTRYEEQGSGTCQAVSYTTQHAHNLLTLS